MKRVYCLHPRCKDLTSFLEYINCGGGKIDEELVWDSKNPEILFATELINVSKKYWKEFRKLYPKAKVHVMFSREAVEPDFNFFDYAIGFNDNLTFDDRFIRLMPPLKLYPNFIFSKENTINTKEEALQELKKKKGFCNFLYSNSNAHPMRDRLFHAICEYKKVDSLGRHLNNIGKKGTGFQGHAAECKDIKSFYKFSIASENAVYPGYTSEKVFTSLEAHTVPIYFGNPHISDDLNPNAIINVNDFHNLDELVEYIAKVDSDDELWASYICQPWFKEKQSANNQARISEYERRLKAIFESPLEDAKRLSVGTHVSEYRKNLLRRKYPFRIDKSLIPKWVFKLKRKLE